MGRLHNVGYEHAADIAVTPDGSRVITAGADDDPDADQHATTAAYPA